MWSLRDEIAMSKINLSLFTNIFGCSEIVSSLLQANRVKKSVYEIKLFPGTIELKVKLQKYIAYFHEINTEECKRKKGELAAIN